MKILLEFTLGGGDNESALPGVGGGGWVWFLQTEGCPVQVNPLVITHPIHPWSKLLPVSHCSPPNINPSPHTG